MCAKKYFTILLALWTLWEMLFALIHKPLTERTAFSGSGQFCPPLCTSFMTLFQVSEETMAVFDDDWQMEKATIRERGIFMFNNDLLSDVRLVVRACTDESDAKKSKMAIPAHKFVLSICSPVFFAMFCGEMAEKSDSIALPDCEYEGVLEMLRYLYSGEVKLNESNVMQVLYVANKYILPSLADECVDFLLRNVDPTNVFGVLSIAQQYEDERLVDQCWEVIDGKTEEVVKSEDFLTIERSLLEDIVKRNWLTIREVELFKAVNLWATQECERQGLAVDGKVKRSILGKQIVKEIRFPTMEEKELASAVLDCNILTDKEMKDLVKHFNGVLTKPLSFSEDRRFGTWKTCCRFDHLVPYNVENGWSYDGFHDVADSIELWVDKDVWLEGIRFFGRKDEIYQVRTMRIMEIKKSKTSETKTLIDFKPSCLRYFNSLPLPLKGNEIDVFDVPFNPVVIRKNKHYVVEASLDGPNSCYGSHGKDTVSCHGVTFHFKDCQKAKLNDATTVSCGQFAEFFFMPVSRH